jgi:pimeloyl-ACP methyl ester carboxylesterase
MTYEHPNTFPKLHNAAWPGVVGKGPGHVEQGPGVEQGVGVDHAHQLLAGVVDARVERVGLAAVALGDQRQVVRAAAAHPGAEHLALRRDPTARHQGHLDHVEPHSSGGGTTAENGQGLCVRCNLTKELPGMVRGQYAEQRLSVPTRLLVGTEDVAVKGSSLEGANADNLVVQWVDGVGHFLPDEAPEVVVQAARELL